MDGLVSRASMIRLSLHPSPASETSAFNKIRAFSSRRAGLFPFRVSVVSRSRSSPLNLTTYVFTEISFAAMIASIASSGDGANHQTLSNWLKQATRFRPISPGEADMKKTVMFFSAMMGVAVLSGPAGAQGVPQSVEIVKVDVQKVAAGYRASKVIGNSVLNDANETIGKIDDLLVTRDGKEPYVVLSIGGFLGMGTHLVVVRYDGLKFDDNKIVLPGGTKDGLKMLPAFEYSK